MPLSLAEVPQILDLLKDGNGEVLSKNQVSEINDYAKEKKIFAGEAAVQMNLVTKENLDKALLNQSVFKATAAASDIDAIVQNGHQETPNWLKANWGNNGVNKAAEKPTLIDGASAAANIAQNITMIANKHPDLAAELKASVDAAQAIALSVSGELPLSKDEASAAYSLAKRGLKEAVEKSGEHITDSKGNAVNVDEFIEERRKEMAAGINMRLAIEEAKAPAANEAGAIPYKQNSAARER